MNIKHTIAMALLMSLTGCALKHIEKPSDSLKINTRAQDETLKATLKTVIVPNGAGAWIKDADWDEYVLNLSNQTSQAVSVYSIQLVDMRGIRIDPEMSPAGLRAKSAQLKEAYANAGSEAAKDMGGQLGGAAASTAYGVAATGLMGVAGFVMAPIAIGAALYGKHAKNKDEAQSQTTFDGRQLPQQLTLDGQASITGSKYYPIAPKSRALVIAYRAGGKVGTLRLSLSGLPKGLREPLEKDEPKEDDSPSAPKQAVSRR